MRRLQLPLPHHSPNTPWPHDSTDGFISNHTHASLYTHFILDYTVPNIIKAKINTSFKKDKALFYISVSRHSNPKWLSVTTYTSYSRLVRNTATSLLSVTAEKITCASKDSFNFQCHFPGAARVVSFLSSEEFPESLSLNCSLLHNPASNSPPHLLH